MKEQFTLDSKGVNEWLTYTYEGGQTRIDSECDEIDMDFVTWLSDRFKLREDQIPFLLNLGELVHESYSAAIQSTLQLRGTIELTKEVLIKKNGEKDNEPAENPKVILKEQQNGTRPKSTTPTRAKESVLEEFAALKFRISYGEVK